jgi:AraC-like DNA-binding protein
VQAIFLSLLACNKKQKSTGDYVLASWLAFIGLHLMYNYLLSSGILFKYPHLLGIGTAFPLLEGPFMFVYVLVMISKHNKFRPIYLLHGIPFLLFTIYFSFTFYTLGASEKLEYMESMHSEMPRELFWVSLPMIILGPMYLIWSLIKLRKHSGNIKVAFSYKEKINLRWLRNVLIFVGFVWAVVIISHIFVRFPFMDFSLHEHLPYLALTVAVFFIGYFGIRQQAIYKNESEQRKNHYRKSGLKKADAKKYAEALLEYFKEEDPYLNGKLSLNEVAGHLEISSNHLSQVLNEELEMSFFDFVNSYRVNEFKSKLEDPGKDHYTLLGIAYECGFNSKASFNGIFKKFSGLTPSQFARQISA